MVPADRIAAPPSLQGGFLLLGVIGRMVIGLFFVWSGVFGIVLEWPARPSSARDRSRRHRTPWSSRAIPFLATGWGGFGPRGVLRREGNPISRLLDAAGAGSP